MSTARMTIDTMAITPTRSCAHLTFACDGIAYPSSLTPRASLYTVGRTPWSARVPLDPPSLSFFPPHELRNIRVTARLELPQAPFKCNPTLIEHHEYRAQRVLLRLRHRLGPPGCRIVAAGRQEVAVLIAMRGHDRGRILQVALLGDKVDDGVRRDRVQPRRGRVVKHQRRLGHD